MRPKYSHVRKYTGDITMADLPSASKRDSDGAILRGPADAWVRSADFGGIMTRVSRSNDRELSYAKSALNKTIHVWPGFEPYQHDGEIDWRVGGKPKTWYLYFQSLRVVGYLANAAEVSGDVRYVDRAAEIIESWYDFHRANGTPPPLAWYDHAVANRVRNVMHLLRAYQSLSEYCLPDPFFQKAQAMLRQHGQWLLDEKNYNPNNHGLMASMALTQLALTFPELDCDGVWRDTGISRVRERIEADLSAENVHREHSPAYHRFFLGLTLQIDGYLDIKGLKLFEHGDKTIEEMKQYMGYVVKPNGRLPMIGDTNDSALSKHYDHPWVTYSLSAGKRGVRPPTSSMVYPDAGVAILRDEWKESDPFPNTTYLMFQSTFHSVTHKHADDLGFVLYSRGEDIFVGPGVAVPSSSKYRSYVKSTQAHNTLTIDGESYGIASANVGKARITAYRLDKAFDFVQGSHTMYDGVTLKRGIVFIRPSTILVIDEAISANERSIQQIWNLSPAAHGLEFDKEGASWFVGENGVRGEIRQLRPTLGVNHYYGQDEPVRGFMSPRQLELVPIHQLEFEKRGGGVVFVTQISVTGQGEEAPTIEVDLDNPYRSIVVHHGDGTTLAIELDSFVGNGE